MRSSLLADEDVDLVDSVAGLRQILTDITADDTDHTHDVQPADDNSTPPPDSKPPDTSEQLSTSPGAVNMPLDDHIEDVQPADDSAVMANYENATEMDETSYEKLENTSQMETEYTDTKETMMDEKYLEAKDQKSDGTSDKEAEYADVDEVLLPLSEAKEYSESEDVECIQEPAATCEGEIKSIESSAVAVTCENMTETDEKLDEKREKTECTDTGGRLVDYAEDEMSDEECEGTMDEDVALPLDEVKEYSATEDMECNKEQAETESEILPDDGSIDNVNYDRTTELDEKFAEITSEMKTEWTDAGEMTADVAKDGESDEERDGTADIGEILLPSSEAKECSETEVNHQDSAETWERELQPTDSSISSVTYENTAEMGEQSDETADNFSEMECTDTSGTMVGEAKDEMPDEREGSSEKEVRSTDAGEVLLPLDEAEEDSETEDVECNQESTETRESEIKCTDDEAVLSEDEKRPELSDSGVKETPEMDGKWSETDAIVITEEADIDGAAAAADILSCDSRHRDDDDGGSDGADNRSSSLAKICADYDDDDEQVVSSFEFECLC